MTGDGWYVSITVSVLSLAISSLTAWLTLFRRGTVRMTRPTVIFLGPDTSRSHEDAALPKIYLRALLFSTSKRGCVIESMHVALRRNETHQNFNIWVYGEEKLVRGSGLFVGESGVAANHHFLAPHDGSSFHFTEGYYRLDVFARLLGDEKAVRLFSQMLEISREVAAALTEPGSESISIGGRIHHVTCRMWKSVHLALIRKSSLRRWASARRGQALIIG